MRRFYLAILAFASAISISSSSIAQSLVAPKGQPILIISGNISNTNVGDTAQFDLPMLEALDMVQISTKSPWYDGVASFDGVRMDKLMALVGAKGKTVRAIALNDYVTTIPIDDFAKFGTIMAIKQNGQYMSVRDKGPLFIIYPFDSNADLQTQTYYGRSAWQLAKLIVE